MHMGETFGLRVRHDPQADVYVIAGRYVYTGNVHDPGGQTTYCSGCSRPVIVRDWYHIGKYEVTDRGACVHCGTVLPGVFDGPQGGWGPRRLPVTVR